MATQSLLSDFVAIELAGNQFQVISALSGLPITLTPERMSERYFSVFFFQTILTVTLHLDAALISPAPPLLLAPSFPHFDPSSSYYNYYSSDEPVELGNATTPSSSSALRPWLRNRLAGTPLEGLSSTTGCAWAGYYTITIMGGVRDRPMYIELRSSPQDVDADSESDRVNFLGQGHDSVGTFTVVGVCDARTGAVSAIKAYATHVWEWRGMVTPFGMAGMWGPNLSGWWWIWPQEWSPTATRRHE